MLNLRLQRSGERCFGRSLRQPGTALPVDGLGLGRRRPDAQEDGASRQAAGTVRRQPAALAETIRDAVAAYNATEQRGRLAGRSPDQVFAAHVEAGWGRTDIAEADLLAAFCRKEVRVVAKGAISFNGRSYYDDALARLPAGSRSRDRYPQMAWRRQGRGVGCARNLPLRGGAGQALCP